ncbi:MAG: putative metal-binding motif-containing protein [Myxococcales bacterium]|nr:putative metal-binding motif-containing protein [Myxococcales bacterium]
MPWAPGPGAGAGGAVSVRDLVERALVTNSVFHVNRSDSGAGALWLIGSPVTMRHLTVVGNVAGKGWGAIDARGQSDVVLDNSLVAHTQGFGAWVADNTEAVGTYDAWWRNTAGPAEGPYEPGITHLFDPPLLQRTTDDCSTAQLWPTASSPLVDAIPYELDLDGSLADIGAYGGLKPLCELQEGYFADLDADGHGDPAAPVRGCDGATGVSLLPTDCDDARSDVSPDEEEVCGDGADNDCDGEVDEDCTDWIDTGTGTTWWTTDLTEEVTGPMDAFAGGGGCTCRHAGGASGWWLGALLLSLGRRSRRRARR